MSHFHCFGYLEIEIALVISRKGEEKMKSYLCTVCGYIYDPALGDPDNGVEPGTGWDDVPEDWVCPLCGVPKELFDVID